MGAAARAGGAHTAHSARQLAWKNTEPRRRTLRSTSDSGSSEVAAVMARPAGQWRTLEQAAATQGQVRKRPNADHQHTGQRCAGHALNPRKSP